VEFIKRFKYPEYPTPEEVIQREYDTETRLEDNFISLKLSIEGHKIVF